MNRTPRPSSGYSTGNTDTTAGNSYLDTTDENDPNYIEPTPFYKSLWFWVLVVVGLMVIVIANKK